jgi:hypothetical protein
MGYISNKMSTNDDSLDRIYVQVIMQRLYDAMAEKYFVVEKVNTSFIRKTDANINGIFASLLLLNYQRKKNGKKPFKFSYPLNQIGEA